MKALVTFHRNLPVDPCGELGGRSSLPEMVEADVGAVHITVTTDDGDVVAAGPLEAFMDLSSKGIQSMRSGGGR